MDGVFDLDAWKGFMLSITAKPVDWTNQPLAGVENVRKCVLDGTSSIGETLQGRTISHWFATSGNNDAELTGGVYLLDGSGVPVGSLGFTASSRSVAATFQPCRHQVALNYRAIARTDA